MSCSVRPAKVPTRERNHNGYLLRWDGEGLLFDPGEGTQRQMLLAGVSATDVTRICLTHFHGDHCLGVPGVVQWISLDQVPHEVTAYYPGSGRDYFARLRYACAFHESAGLREVPLDGPAEVARGAFGTLSVARLEHGVEAYGYRLVEPDGVRTLPEALAAQGIAGPSIGQLQRDGQLRVDGRTVTLAQVSVPRPGQRFACRYLRRLRGRGKLRRA